MSNHMLSPVSCSKYLNMRIVLGTPNTEGTENKSFSKILDIFLASLVCLLWSELFLLCILVIFVYS